MSDNPDEIFDLVDANDCVIGTARRADVHANGWLHRAVHVIVQRSNGDVFLQKRSMSKDCHPGVWDSSASGHLDSGETYHAAAVRELSEELGIDVDPDTVKEVASLPPSDMTGNEFVRIYSARHDGPFSLHPQEIDDGKWLAIQELDNWLTRESNEVAPCFHLVWEQARQHFTNCGGQGTPR